MLRMTFRRVRVDPRRIGVAGYSDGASYAISLGLANGDLLRHVTAFSPGFVADAQRRGRPVITVTHGSEDPVLPIDATSREIVPALRADGYTVRYREFEGGHKIPHPLLPWALRWLE
jgi:phospholipase/carboxylesterase